MFLEQAEIDGWNFLTRKEGSDEGGWQQVGGGGAKTKSCFRATMWHWMQDPTFPEAKGLPWGE